MIQRASLRHRPRQLTPAEMHRRTRRIRTALEVFQRALWLLRVNGAAAQAATAEGGSVALTRVLEQAIGDVWRCSDEYAADTWLDPSLLIDDLRVKVRIIAKALDASARARAATHGIAHWPIEDARHVCELGRRWMDLELWNPDAVPDWARI